MNKEKGAIMVEATLIFPVVLMTVFAMIYLGLFKLQEMAVIYQVQRAAHQGGMILASPGYQALGTYDDKAIDFTSAPADVNEYYKACHAGLSTLYREIFGTPWSGAGEQTEFLKKIGGHASILAGMPLTTQEAKIKRGFLGSTLTVEVSIGLNTPGALRYLGLPDKIWLKRGASSFALSPSTFIRGIDLAGDAIVVVSEKLGIDGHLEKLTEKFGKFRDLIF